MHREQETVVKLVRVLRRERERKKEKREKEHTCRQTQTPVKVVRRLMLAFLHVSPRDAAFRCPATRCLLGTLFQVIQPKKGKNFKVKT